MKQAPTTYAPLFTFLGTSADSIVADGEIVVVNFAGLGGACAGIEDALHRPVTHAINHDPVAISLHRTNNPHTIHHVQDVWAVDPLDIAAGRRIALAWFSPDCKHFSKAKGGAPREKNIRDLAWVTTRYTALPNHLKPRIVFLENVEEFKTWGPLDEEGQPCKIRQGETFREFVATIQSHGYEVEWKELRACDYGAPTTRKRLFLIARRDGEPITWPAPTHGDPTSDAVKRGERLPWRTAAECIDWSLDCPSIFDRKKPLVEATRRRIARGLKKFVKEAKEPFIVTCNHSGKSFRGQAVHEPMKTITAAYDAHGIVDPLLSPFLTNKQFQSPSRPVGTPLSTITTNHNKSELLVALMVKSGHHSNITGEGSHFRGQPVTRPLSTVTAGGNHPMVTVANLIHFYGIKSTTEVRGQGLNTPVKTQTTENRHGLVTASLIKHFGGNYTGSGVSLERPADTVTSVDHHALLTANLVQYNGTSDAQGVARPMPTVVSHDRFGLACATLTRHFGTSRAAEVTAPVGTITTQGSGKTGLVLTELAPTCQPDEYRKARLVYALLNEFAPECLTETDHAAGLVFVDVAGETYLMADIGMRMLTPRELARCQGFRDTYVLEHTAEGKPVSKAAQVRGVGNSVCPPIARALVAAQFQMAQAAD